MPLRASDPAPGTGSKVLPLGVPMDRARVESWGWQRGQKGGGGLSSPSCDIKALGQVAAVERGVEETKR